MMFSLTCSVLSNGRKASSTLKSKFLYSDGNQAGIMLPTSFVAVQKNIVRVVSRSPFLPRERSSGYHRQDLCCGRCREGGRYYVMPSWTVLGVRRPTWVHKSEYNCLEATLQYRCRFGEVPIIGMRGRAVRPELTSTISLLATRDSGVLLHEERREDRRGLLDHISLA